jgi:site-specific recombinase XerD
MMGRMTTRSIERVVGDYGQAARLDKLTPHMLRHSFAKVLVDRGVSIDQVAQLLGHSNLNTTRIYTRPSEQDLARAVEMLGEV